MEPTAKAEASLRTQVDAAPVATTPIETGMVQTVIDLAHLAHDAWRGAPGSEVLRHVDRHAEILLAHMRDACCRGRIRTHLERLSERDRGRGRCRGRRSG